MLLGRPWLKDAKVSHNYGTNTITIQGISIVRTILVTKKLNIQTKWLEVLVYYDFHYRIFDDEEDVMFATKLDLFSIGIIAIPIHTEHVPKPVNVPNIIMAKPILKQHVVPIYVLTMKLIIPPNIIKQHIPEIFFHP